MSVLGPAPDAAQELPASVASSLVEQALADSIVAPSNERGRASLPIWVPAAVAACLLLALAVRRVRRAAPNGVPTQPTPNEEREEGAPTRRTRASRPQPPRETLVLPPHVLEIIQKSAERRRLAASATASPPMTEEPIVDTPGIDIVLPGYDPTAER